MQEPPGRGGRCDHSSREGDTSVQQGETPRHECVTHVTDIHTGHVHSIVNSKLSLNCYYTNAQSIVNKRNEFLDLMDRVKPKIIGISESWCNDDIQLSEIQLTEFDVWRGDRKDRKGGGVVDSG